MHMCGDRWGVGELAYVRMKATCSNFHLCGPTLIPVLVTTVAPSETELQVPVSTLVSVSFALF